MARTFVKEEPMNVLREFTLERNLANVMKYGKVFYSKGNLTRHHQIIHVGEKLTNVRNMGSSSVER